jgi:hypothetical protein
MLPLGHNGGKLNKLCSNARQTVTQDAAATHPGPRIVPLLTQVYREGIYCKGPPV